MAREVHTVAVIGAGKIGELMLSGLLRSGWPVDRLLATARRPARAEELADRYGVRVVDNLTAVAEAEVLAVSVKPQDAAALLDEIGPKVPADKLVISLCAGLPTAFFNRRLPEGTPVVRVMTNTPALVDQAMTRDLGGRVRHRRAPGPGRGDVLARSARPCGCPSRSRTRSPRSPAPARPTSTCWSRR